MSVYHKWRTVFVQIPKTATSAIHAVLGNLTDNNHDHRLYIDILSQNDPELIESYYSFSIVRNPYDRFVSCYEYMRSYSNGEGWNGMSFEEYVNMFHRRGRFFYTNEDIIWWPQARFVAIKKILLIDEVIRYEDLNKEWPRIVENIINIVPEGFSRPKDFLEKVNVSDTRSGRNWEDYYTPELKQKVYEMYRRDFELFKYPK